MTSSQNVEVFADIVAVKRRLNSLSGNPRYDLLTDKGLYRTSDDADCNYGVKDVVDGPVPVKLTIDGRGKVVGIEYLS